MHVLDHLIKEHREAEKLMEALDKSEPGDERDATIDNLINALSVHMAVEERFLYPIVAETLDAETVDEANTEHDLATDGLAKLKELADQPGFGAALDMLKAGIGHHVEEEESEIFPKLRKRAADQLGELDPDELEAAVKRDSDGVTRKELYREAQESDIAGRSTMTKDELAEAVSNQ